MVPGGVDGFAVGAGGEGNVIGVLIAALNFEATDTGGDDLGDELNGGEVAGGEQIAGIGEGAFDAIDQQFIRQAAGLGALATVGAAATPGFGGKALAGVSDAERAVDEDFEIGVGFGVDGGDFLEGQLAGEGDAVCALGEGELDAFGAGDAGLGGGVELEIGGDLAGEAEDAQVLHDEGVDAGFGNGGDGAGGFDEFVFEDEGVEGEVAADAALVQGAHDGGEFGKIEANFGAGGEVLEAEVAGVGASFDGGPQLGPMPGGAHDLWFMRRAHPFRVTRLLQFDPIDFALFIQGKVDGDAGQHAERGGVLSSVAFDFVESAAEGLVGNGVGKVADVDGANAEDLAQADERLGERGGVWFEEHGGHESYRLV